MVFLVANLGPTVANLVPTWPNGQAVFMLGLVAGADVQPRSYKLCELASCARARAEVGYVGRPTGHGWFLAPASNNGWH